jgi:hypothetical protein
MQYSPELHVQLESLLGAGSVEAMVVG